MKQRALLATVVVTALLAGTTAGSAAPSYTQYFQDVARGDQSTESTYFVMTDRFANGDSSNDTGGYQDLAYAGFDPTDIGYWHGGDFQGLTAQLDYIKSLGVSSIWVTPPMVQQSVQGNSAAYHGYWALDFLNVDPHLGGNQAFKNFVDQAHQRGLKVILDVVANHTADVIQYNNGKAYIPAGRELAKNPAFLNDITNYHNQGISTFEGQSALLGDFGGLDDIATEKPVVVKGFIDIWSHWITTFGIDGMRIDTFRHVNPEFWQQVIPAVQMVALKAGKKKFPIFGEVYDGSPENLSQYLVTGQTPSVLDFAFNDQLTRYVASYGTADRLAKFFNLDDLYTTSKTSAYGLATFLGNHDMGRIGTAIYNNATNKDEALRRDLIAQSALLLLRGGPILYYGDEKGMTGGGGDKLARQDMFATSVDRWKYEQRIGSDPVGDRSSFDLANPIQNHITTLEKIIASNPALRSGTQQTLYAQGQQFAVARYSAGQEYVVAFNTADSEKSFALAPITKSAIWQNLAGGCSATRSLTLTIEANSFCLLKASTKLGKSATSKVTAPRVEDSNDSPLYRQISVSVNAPGYNSVAFIARERGGKWKNLGTSDHTTFQSEVTVGNRYRIFLHPTDFKKNAELELMAIVKTSDGKFITSAIGKAKNS